MGLPRPRLITIIHWLIMLWLLQAHLYAGYQVMFVIGDGGGMPLFGKAALLDYETVALRRYYAIESWLAFGALAVYVGITEVLPRWQPMGGTKEA